MKNYIIITLSVLVILLGGILLYGSFNGEMTEAEVQADFRDLKDDYELLQTDLENKMILLETSGKVIEIQKQKLDHLMKKNSITEEELAEAKNIMGEISQSVLDDFHKMVASLEKEKVGLLSEKKYR